MAKWTTESARFMLRSRGGRKAAISQRPLGFPGLVKAREIQALMRARKKAQELADLFDANCPKHCPCVSKLLAKIKL